jgi:hypothetical protein
LHVCVGVPAGVVDRWSLRRGCWHGRRILSVGAHEGAPPCTCQSVCADVDAPLPPLSPTYTTHTHTHTVLYVCVCGAPGIFGQARLCDYNGHSYCTDCHLNELVEIPGRCAYRTPQTHTLRRSHTHRDSHTYTYAAMALVDMHREVWRLNITHGRPIHRPIPTHSAMRGAL